jgi:hypothetical protein
MYERFVLLWNRELEMVQSKEEEEEVLRKRRRTY